MKSFHTKEYITLRNHINFDYFTLGIMLKKTYYEINCTVNNLYNLFERFLKLLDPDLRNDFLMRMCSKYLKTDEKRKEILISILNGE